MAGLAKRTFIKLKNRNWINSYIFYSNKCFALWYNNTLQERKSNEIANLLRQCGYEITKFSNCIKFNLIGDCSYCGIVKLNMKRTWKKL